jgi:hypothetical protein
MSDTKTEETSLALLDAQIDQLARQVGKLEPGDPKRAELIKEIFRLTELAAEMKQAGA